MRTHGRPTALDGYSPPPGDGVHAGRYRYAALSSAAGIATTFRYPLTSTFPHKPTPSISLQTFASPSSSSKAASPAAGDGDGNGDGDGDGDGDGIEIEIETISKNRRRIRSKVAVAASLQTVWGILTDYERLADFIPGLAVSQVLQKGDKFARLFQIGQQELAFGLKFNAKGIVDCYEKDFQSLPSGQSRDIEFEMIEGDFQLFQGKWSIQQCRHEGDENGAFVNQEYGTSLSYVVDVEPKMWLPVRLVEGRLCREIKINLISIREAAQEAAASSNGDPNR